MRLLFRFARAYPTRTLITLLALVLAGVAQGVSLTALLPVLKLAAGDGGASADGLAVLLAQLGVAPSLGVLLGVIVAGMTVKSILILFANRHVGYTVAQIATDLRLQLLRALLAARWDYFLHQPTGVLTNAMVTETLRASSAYLNGARTAALFIETVAVIAVAATVSWQATLGALGAGLLIVYGFGRFVRAARRAGRRQTKVLASLLSRMTDMLQSVKALKSMGLAGKVGRVLETETGRLNRALRKEVTSTEALTALQEPVIVGFMALGLYVTVTGLALPLASVMVLVLLLLRVLKSLGKMQQNYQRMAANESAYWSLDHTLQGALAAGEAPGRGRPPRFERELTLEDVEVAYGDKAVLRGIRLRLPAGSFTTLVGPSGAGKTTVLDLITGLVQPTSGRVLLDGVPLEECNLDEWRRMIGYVPQEPLLLHDTVLHNITLGDPGLTAADAEGALRAAGAWEFVAALPEGILTVVGERGSRLSGGQRQRVSIARALVRGPRLLILDEATSALDPASEAAVCETLAGLRGSVTILAVSHQAALGAVADRVLRLENGELLPAAANGVAEDAPGDGRRSLHA